VRERLVERPRPSPETSGFFGEVVEAGFHETSIRMVAAGDVDASAIDSQVLAIAMRDDLVERFVPVSPEDYDDIRMMVEACEAAGFTELR
jgi:hypothetical protein